jgi:hypothetical protein
MNPGISDNIYYPGTNDNSKIIKFDHRLHITDAGVKCEECHSTALKSVSSRDNLNPKHDNCSGCHDVKDDNNCSLCHFDKKKKIKQTDWNLNFSHKYHIETEKKECTSCHWGLDKVKYAKETPASFPMMENCFACHDNQKATNFCDACHTNLTKLTPFDHKKPNFLNEHTSNISGLTTEKKNCMMCHSDNFCQACHSAPGYEGNNTKVNFFAPYYTKENATRTDRTSLQKLTTIHNINQRYTHGLDARQKSFECKTCHDPVSFCSACHQNGGELVTGFKPQSHLQTNFTTIGVNTGGGLHSVLAKKDIESCQSCHETDGADPVCVTCHYDADGVRGSNPKTHESGFLKDEKGIWHETKGAVCYICHTDWNAKPEGRKGLNFCGYCHQ